VLQGSKVVLDVEEEGLDERTVLSLDAATKISPSGSTCFTSSDGKEHCFADAQPGECSSFADHDGHRQLFIRKVVKKVETQAQKEAREAKEAADRAAAAAAAAEAAAKAAADKAGKIFCVVS
jgi:hypothetical protein